MLWLATNTIRRLGAYGRTLIGYENYHNALWLATTAIRRLGLHERESKRVPDGLTYKDDGISGYTSSRQVATKMRSLMIQFESLCQTLKLYTKSVHVAYITQIITGWIKLNLVGFLQSLMQVIDEDTNILSFLLFTFHLSVRKSNNTLCLEIYIKDNIHSSVLFQHIWKSKHLVFACLTREQSRVICL